jgi:hypothetical protein
VLLLSGGEHDAAVSELQAVLEQDPNNKSAQMYLRIAQGSRSSASPPAADQ